MSGEQRRSEVPQGPPWALDLLADLHADALDPETTRELFPLARRDPAATEALAGLDATRRDLAELPSLRMPDAVTERICTALAAEAGSAAAPVVELDQLRRRRRRMGWGIGALAAAAAVLAVLVTAPMLLRPAHEVASTPSTPPPGSPMTFNGGDIHLDRTQLAEALRSREYAPTLSDQRTLQGCLQANGASGQPIGARIITLDGNTAQMLILPTGALGKFQVLVVGIDCAANHPATLSDNTFGG